MSVFTPTSVSTAAAGAGWWSVMWSFLFKSNHFPFIKRFIPRDRILNWISGHKVEALIFTEVFNMTTHTGVFGTMFALGGTVVNTFVIFVIFPLRSLRRRKTALKGAHA